MLIQVDDVVINTDHIKFINILSEGKKLKIFFDTEVTRTLSFPHSDDLNRFLENIGRNKIFA